MQEICLPVQMNGKIVLILLVQTKQRHIFLGQILDRQGRDITEMNSNKAKRTCVGPGGKYGSGCFCL